MSANAASQIDHSMLVAANDACQIVEPVPDASIAFFTNQLCVYFVPKNADDAAIAAASLILAGQTLPDPQAVADLMLAAQATQEGGFGDGGSSSLFVTYCVMRTLVLLNVMPDIQRLSAYLD